MIYLFQNRPVMKFQRDTLMKYYDVIAETSNRAVDTFMNNIFHYQNKKIYFLHFFYGFTLTHIKYLCNKTDLQKLTQVFWLNCPF